MTKELYFINRDGVKKLGAHKYLELQDGCEIYGNCSNIYGNADKTLYGDVSNLIGSLEGLKNMNASLFKSYKTLDKKVVTVRDCRVTSYSPDMFKLASSVPLASSTRSSDSPIVEKFSEEEIRRFESQELRDFGTDEYIEISGEEDSISSSEEELEQPRRLKRVNAQTDLDMAMVHRPEPQKKAGSFVEMSIPDEAPSALDEHDPVIVRTELTDTRASNNASCCVIL